MSSPKTPKPSQEERALQQSQGALLEEQRRALKAEREFRVAQLEQEKARLPQEEEARKQGLALQQQQLEGLRRQELLQETLYESLGLEKQVDAEGRVTGYKKVRETPEEKLSAAFSQFQTGQIERQKEQERLQDLLYPSLLESQGYRLTRDAAGKPVGVELTEEAQEERGQRKLARERQTKALKGELDVDPALTKQLADEEVALRESLRKQLGGDYATSTPGIEALSQFSERKNSILAGARRGEISLGEQLQASQVERARGGAGNAANLGQLGLRNVATANIGQGDVLRSLYGRGGTVGSTGGGGFGAPGAATFGDVFGGGQALLGGFQEERARRAQALARQKASRSATFSTIGSALGTVIGAATGYGVGAPVGAALGSAAGYGLAEI